MRIDIVGAGAVGGTLAVLLAKAGEDVAVVAREDAAPVIARGLTLMRDGRVIEAHPPVLPTTRREADLILLAVKTQDTTEAARRVTPGPGAVVVLANGLAADALAARALPGRRVAPSIVVFDAGMDAPGRYSVNRIGGILLPRDAPAEADALGRAMPVTRRDDFEGARWTKLLVNLGNGLNAATGLAAQDAYRKVGARVGVQLLREGLAVAAAEGVRLAPLPWADPRQLRFLVGLPGPVAALALSLKVRVTFRGLPATGSTLQSLRRGRPTEVRWLNGEVAARGRAHGVSTPANDAVVAAVEAAEKGGGVVSAEALWGACRGRRGSE